MVKEAKRGGPHYSEILSEVAFFFSSQIQYFLLFQQDFRYREIHIK